MHSLPRNPSSNIPFWPYSSWPSPLSFSLSLPPFLSLPLSGKSHGFPEVEHHKAWSAGGSLPSFIFMLCLSSLHAHWSRQYHVTFCEVNLPGAFMQHVPKTFPWVSGYVLFCTADYWRALHFLRCVAGLLGICRIIISVIWLLIRKRKFCRGVSIQIVFCFCNLKRLELHNLSITASSLYDRNQKCLLTQINK